YLDIRIKVRCHDLAGYGLRVFGGELDIHRHLWLQHTDGALDRDIARGRMSRELLDTQRVLISSYLPFDIGQTRAQGIVSDAPLAQLDSAGDLRRGGVASNSRVNHHTTGHVPPTRFQYWIGQCEVEMPGSLEVGITACGQRRPAGQRQL